MLIRIQGILSLGLPGLSRSSGSMSKWELNRPVALPRTVTWSYDVSFECSFTLNETAKLAAVTARLLSIPVLRHLCLLEASLITSLPAWFPGSCYLQTLLSIRFMDYGACMVCHFSHVWLFATLWTVAQQAPLSTGLFRQEYWSRLSGLPGPPPWTKVLEVKCLRVSLPVYLVLNKTH